MWLRLCVNTWCVNWVNYILAEYPDSPNTIIQNQHHNAHIQQYHKVVVCGFVAYQMAKTNTSIYLLYSYKTHQTAALGKLSETLVIYLYDV